MRILIPAAILLAACAQSRKAETSDKGGAAPKIGKATALYEVVDSKGRQRIGFVEKTEYEGGGLIWWVSGLDRGVRRGYIVGSGRAYRYVWLPGGQRAQEPADLGVDTIAFGVRRILEHDAGVDLVSTSEKKLGEEMLAARAKAEAPKGAEPPAEGAAEGGSPQ